jgi:hypothetical protein
MHIGASSGKVVIPYSTMQVVEGAYDFFSSPVTSSYSYGEWIRHVRLALFLPFPENTLAAFPRLTLSLFLFFLFPCLLQLSHHSATIERR